MRLLLDKGASNPVAPASGTPATAVPQKPATTGQQTAPAAKPAPAPAAGALMTKALAGFGAGAGAKKTAPLAAAVAAAAAAAPALSPAPPSPAPAEPNTQGQGQSKPEQSAPGGQKPNNLENKGSGVVPVLDSSHVYSDAIRLVFVESACLSKLLQVKPSDSIGLNKRQFQTF